MKKFLGGALLTASVAVFALGGVHSSAQTMGQDTMMAKSGYVEYSQKAFDAAAKMRRVLFFAASWCPTCRSADKDFTQNIKQLPKDAIIFKTDYDTESALKTKYGITRQHTFVIVDAKSMAVRKWSGGGIAEVVKMLGMK
jgi:thiol-disulfide isomerase/thioredoxin